MLDPRATSHCCPAQCLLPCLDVHGKSPSARKPQRSGLDVERVPSRTQMLARRPAGRRTERQTQNRCQTKRVTKGTDTDKDTAPTKTQTRTRTHALSHGGRGWRRLERGPPSDSLARVAQRPLRAGFAPTRSFGPLTRPSCTVRQAIRRAWSPGTQIAHRAKDVIWAYRPRDPLRRPRPKDAHGEMEDSAPAGARRGASTQLTPTNQCHVFDWRWAVNTPDRQLNATPSGIASACRVVLPAGGLPTRTTRPSLARPSGASAL